MGDFKIKKIISTDITKELMKIGFDSNYANQATEKYQFENIKIYNLTPAQANIIKQTALSLGADCATHRDVITGKIENSDAILGGTKCQIRRIANKLQYQPFSLKDLSKQLLKILDATESSTKIVGIVNVTPDSFSDGGKFFKPENAIAHALQLIQDGADILDIGAESTRPNATDISAEEQIKRLAPVLEGLKHITTPISIDTRSSIVAEYVLQNGATIINDVSGLDFDCKMSEIIAKYNATVIIQHSQGTPENMQINPTYNDIVEDIYKNLESKTSYAKSQGIGNIILDVGIGFGKTQKHNFELLNRIEEFKSIGYPLMVGVSRKSLLGIPDNNNDIKDAITLGISYPMMKSGIEYLRVHNVKLHKHLLQLSKI